MIDGTAGRTGLYRLFGRDTALVYIGIAVDVERRMRQHARTKSWWPEVDEERTRVEWFDTRDEAETAELAAIRDEKPKYNVVTADESGCARFLPREGDRRWGRPSWTPGPEHEQILREVDERVEEARYWEAELWARVEAARNLDVPLNFLADVIGRGRATVHRHVQPRPKDASE